MQLLYKPLTLVILLFNFQSKVVFDIPMLSNKNMVQIRKILGKPRNDVVPSNYQTQAGATGDAFFEKNGFTLEITYNPTNNKIIDFFISKDHSVADYTVLKIAGNIVKNNKFILNPIHENKNPSLYTGITVTPK